MAAVNWRSLNSQAGFAITGQLARKEWVRMPRKQGTDRDGDTEGVVINLRKFVPYRISILSSLIGHAISKSYSTNPGLSLQEWKVLSILGHHGAIPSADVGRHTTLDRVAISRALAKLEKRGLLTRKPHTRDQRMFMVTLTDRGKSVYSAIAARALEIERSVLDVLEPEEIDLLFSVFDKLEASFRDNIDPRRPALINLLNGFTRDIG